MSSTNSERKDHWNSQAYNSSAGFVPKLTTTVVSFLDPQPTDKILDIGCGDGVLTAQIAQTSASVLGIDASKSFISTAKERYGASSPNCEFQLHDATNLQSSKEAMSGGWDKVFSNAAMHWILRNPSTRIGFFDHVNQALKPGGTFVFEMGGKGNVAEIQAASISALIHAGVPVHQAREACPWFFPSAEWMRTTLEGSGFEVERLETEYRPSKLETNALDGWVRLMCAEFLEHVPEGKGKREEVVQEICNVIETIITREEDGSKWLGYLRLRGVARKK